MISPVRALVAEQNPSEQRQVLCLEVLFVPLPGTRVVSTGNYQQGSATTTTTTTTTVLASSSSSTWYTTIHKTTTTTTTTITVSKL